MNGVFMVDRVLLKDLIAEFGAGLEGEELGEREGVVAVEESVGHLAVEQSVSVHHQWQGIKLDSGGYGESRRSVYLLARGRHCDWNEGWSLLSGGVLIATGLDKCELVWREWGEIDGWC